MGAAAAAVIIAKERHIVDRFRDAGVTSSATARPLDDVGVSEGLALRRLRRHEAVREASPGMFYLDEPVWNAVRNTRRQVLIVIFLIALLMSFCSALGFLSLK